MQKDTEKKTSQETSSQGVSTHGTIKEIHRILEDHLGKPIEEERDKDTGKVRRRYRKAAERPRPDLPPDADINKLDAHYQSRISRDLSNRVEAFRAATGMSKKEVTEQALRLFLEVHNDKS